MESNPNTISKYLHYCVCGLFSFIDILYHVWISCSRNAFVCFFFDLMLNVHGKQLRSCRDGQLLNHTVLGQASGRKFTIIRQ